MHRLILLLVILAGASLAGLATVGSLAFVSAGPTDSTRDGDLPQHALRRFGAAGTVSPIVGKGCGAGAFAAAISPDGNTVATGHGCGLALWNVDSGEVLHTIANRGSVFALEFSPDGRQLAWGGFGNSFALVDPRDGAPLFEPDT